MDPYSFRQSLARELRRRRVPDEEISLMLGNLSEDLAAITSIYAPHHHRYDRRVFEELQKKMRLQVVRMRIGERNRFYLTI